MKLDRMHIFIIPVVLFISIFLYCDRLPVIDLEAINFMTAKEILQKGSWLIPTLEGNVRIEKPPLPTWLTTLPMIMTGTDTDLVADRIPVGICALVLILFTYLLAKRIAGDRGSAVSAVLVLATTCMFMVSARRNVWDIYAVTAMTGALWAMLEVFCRKEGKNLYFLLFSLLMFLSFSCKGPVAFWTMLIPFLISYCMTYTVKDLRENKRGLLWAFALCIVLSAAWPLYVYASTPHASTLAAAKESHAWFTKYAKPVWFYLLHIQEVVGVWILFLVYGLAVSLLDKNRKPWEKMSTLWFILTIVFLSVFPEKKARYLLPAVVPGCLVTAITINRLKEARGWSYRAICGLFCIMGILFIAAASAVAYYSPGGLLYLLGALLIGLAGCSISYAFIRKNTHHVHVVATAGICLIFAFGVPLLPMHRLIYYLGTNDAQQFLHVRENPEIMARDIYSFGFAPSYVIKWAVGKKVGTTDIERIMILKEQGKGIALITMKPMNRKTLGLRFAETIRTDTRPYFIYLMH
ncbi:MAG TPA: glycosyltransferase family 39 protein [Desulfomonilia bacterium]|nr:glycosyltransferase family 39 protein [Desulfomonilia bacterium]